MSSQVTPIGRIWLADHLLRDRLGHHVGYNQLLADAAKNAGWGTMLLTHRDFPEGSLSGHRVVRIFRNDWRAAPPPFLNSSVTGLKLLELFSAKRFAGDLNQLFRREKFGAGDIIFAQMLAPRHLACWLRWFARFDASLAPALVFHLGYGASRFRANSGLKDALHGLRKRGLDRHIYFISDSASLAAEYGGILNTDVRVLPHVVSVEVVSPLIPRDKEPVHFVSLGNARAEKGFGDLAEALLKLDRNLLGTGVKFSIQCHQPDRKCAEAVERLARSKLTGVRLIRDDLDDKEYRSLLASSDVVLLPYHLDKYAMRTSGVFCEALVAGKPVIATQGSWMSDEIAKTRGGWLVPERNPVELARAMATVSREFESVASGCRERAPDYKKLFSAEAFINGLMEIVNHGYSHRTKSEAEIFPQRRRGAGGGD